MTDNIIVIPTPDTFNMYLDKLPGDYGDDTQFRTTVIEAAIHRGRRYGGFSNNFMGVDTNVGADYLESYLTPDHLHEMVLELIENTIETLTITIMKYLADEMITDKSIYVYGNDRDIIMLSTYDLTEP